MTGDSTSVLTLQYRQKTGEVEALRTRFSAHQCFAFDGGTEDRKCLQLLGEYLQAKPDLAVYGDGKFFNYLLDHVPGLESGIKWVILDDEAIPSDRQRKYVACPLSLPVHYLTVSRRYSWPRP